jgi:predicted component of type VI protein secretion system
MDPNALRDQLEKLHAELKDAPQVDPRSNQLMIEVLQDIQRLLEQKRAAAVPPPPGSDATLPEPDETLPGRLEQVAVQFEADHPTLAASSRRLIDLLGKAGL